MDDDDTELYCQRRVFQAIPLHDLIFDGGNLVTTANVPQTILARVPSYSNAYGDDPSQLPTRTTRVTSGIGGVSCAGHADI